MVVVVVVVVMVVMVGVVVMLTDSGGLGDAWLCACSVCAGRGRREQGSSYSLMNVVLGVLGNFSNYKFLIK